MVTPETVRRRGGMRTWWRGSTIVRRLVVVSAVVVVTTAGAIATIPPLRLLATHTVLSRVTLLHHEVDGDTVVLEGAVNGRAVGQFLDLLGDHPEIDTVVLRDVTGSIDDEATFEIARVIRARGLATVVPDGGRAESGGVDLFTAGVERRLGHGARLGVHEWQDFTATATDFEPDAEEHLPYRAFYTEMLGSDAFYWFTIRAAPPDRMHHLTPDEIARFGIVTPA